jgi:TolA-binding protein
MADIQNKVCLNHPTTPAVWRFGAARRIVERSIEVFPKQEWVDEAYYQVALCDEKNGNDERTMKGYRRFLKKYPTTQYRRRRPKPGSSA